MNKNVAIIALILLTFFVTSTAFAAGGKVRGEKGQGGVHQVQVRNTDDGNCVF